ncbi:MAG: NYN domain-containing protein [Actinobacteria bacterium]|nr:NYN domain-containing protein [Actinomycetota bacterium]
MRNQQTPNPRHLVAIDLENLAGTPCVSLDWAKEFGPFLAGLLHLSAQDLVYVAGSPSNGMAVCTAASELHGQARTKRGKNGADLVLLDALESIPESALSSPDAPIDVVVIGSGDGIFTQVARRFRDKGLTVVGVSRRRSMHRALAAACSRVIYLDGQIGHDMALAA